MLIAFLIENMAPIMFCSLMLFLLLGYPVAFSLSAVGLAYAWIGIELGLFTENFMGAMPERVFGIMANETLLAIPFFTLMGLILERSGMAEDLIDTIGQLFGPIRGGLAYAVIFVGALLAATTGVVAASVISMGLIALPIMMRYGYDRFLATGVIMASGTLAQTIPPSIILIVLADQLGTSVGDMYRGALVPALVLTLLYALYVFGLTILRPNAAPALPPEARKLTEPDGTVG
ncbi:MAG TPA: TRAP transporter large permease subunit, partial [Candidimonas sp.]|nr:TRAP transporter large permease subunit [Candidimonas sp.]